MDTAGERMYVVKRDGRHESVMFDKITSRIAKLCYELDMNFIDPTAITMKVSELALARHSHPRLLSSSGHIWSLFWCHDCPVG